MYGLFFDQSAQDSTQLLEFVRKWKTEHKLRTQEYLLKDLEEIRSISKEVGDKFTTLIAIGTPSTFHALVAEARHYSNQTVFGYIPTSHDNLARRLGIKDYKDGCQVITQRKIIDMTALSVNQEYFLFDYHLKPKDTVETTVAEVEIIINKEMKVRMPADHIVLHNRHQELQHHNSPLLVESFLAQQYSKQQNNLLKLELAKKIKTTQPTEQLQFRLPADQLIIESSITLANSLHHKTRSPIKVGIHSRIIRLIIKRGQELQSIMSSGLIS